MIAPRAVSPPPVLPGARVGVAALSGPVDAGRLAAGLRELERLGFEPVTAANLGRRDGLFAGTQAERLRAFHDLAADPSLAAIFFARGGHGLLPILPALDWDLLASHPRAYVGYSDLTPLLLAVVEKLGLVSLHGPMVAVDLARGLSGDEETCLLDALAGRAPAPLPVEGATADAEGVLLGGCLSLLTATLGTPFATRFDDALLFWEDVAEPLYRIDRMLTHLDLSGNLKSIRAVIAGRVRAEDEAPESEPAVVERMRARFPGRALGWGLTAGHGTPNWTLPLGRRAALDAASGRLVFEGS